MMLVSGDLSRCCSLQVKKGAASTVTPTTPPTGEVTINTIPAPVAGGGASRSDGLQPTFVCVFREFEVQAASAMSMEVIGQGAEPLWISQLSTDSTCSEGSAGSAEPQQHSGQFLSVSCSLIQSSWWRRTSSARVSSRDIVNNVPVNMTACAGLRSYSS